MASESTYVAVPEKEDQQYVQEIALNVSEDDLQDSQRLLLPSRWKLWSRQSPWTEWQKCVAASATLCCFVLVINIVLTVVAVLRFTGDMTAGIGTLTTGSCELVDSLSIGLHLVINILSSAMLSASNYTMQSLAAPTRSEVNKAHSKGNSLDLGLLTLRNTMGGGISFWRELGIWVLLLSSVPVHLLFNSAIFKTIDNNLYDIFLANEEWLDGAPFNASHLPEHGPGSLIRYYTYNASGRYYDYDYDHPNPHEDDTYHDPGPSYDELRQKQKFFADNNHNESLVQRLENADCIAKYGTYYLSGGSDVLLITSHHLQRENQTFLWWGSVDNERWKWPNSYDETSPLEWVFPGGDAKWIRAHPDRWTRNNYIVDYCLTKVIEPKCKLQFTLQVLIAVVVCNAVKSTVMLFVLFSPRHEPLVTLGDAVSSFLQDPFTGLSPVERKFSDPKKPRRWCHTSPGRWLVTLPICLAGISISAYYLNLGLNWAGEDRTWRNILQRGFGTLDPAGIIGSGPPQRGFKGLISAILLSNLPQLICSLIYLAYNGLFTSMLLGVEWSSYSLHKKPLRVSKPVGEQKSTYWLQLPFRYSVPLLIASTTLHWLISQSLFLSRVVTYRDGLSIDPPGQEASRIAFSCLPILIVIIMGSLLVIVAICFGQRKLPLGKMPLVGSDSSRIAAECQRPVDDTQAAFKPVAWGAVDVQSELLSEGGTREHCCFTSWDVRTPALRVGV